MTGHSRIHCSWCMSLCVKREQGKIKWNEPEGINRKAEILSAGGARTSDVTGALGCQYRGPSPFHPRYPAPPKGSRIKDIPIPPTARFLIIVGDDASRQLTGLWVQGSEGSSLRTTWVAPNGCFLGHCLCDFVPYNCKNIDDTPFGHSNMCYCFSGFPFRTCEKNLSCGLSEKDLWCDD